VFELKEEWNF